MKLPSDIAVTVDFESRCYRPALPIVMKCFTVSEVLKAHNKDLIFTCSRLLNSFDLECGSLPTVIPGWNEVSVVKSKAVEVRFFIALRNSLISHHLNNKTFTIVLR